MHGSGSVSPVDLSANRAKVTVDYCIHIILFKNFKTQEADVIAIIPIAQLKKTEVLSILHTAT